MKRPKLKELAGIGTGALIGGGLAWLGWRWLDRNNVDPLGLFRKKVEEGNRVYYDPANDPNLEGFDLSNPGSLAIDDGDEGIDDEDEEEETEYTPPEEPAGHREPYQIDEEQFYRSEEDENYKHGHLRYFTEDRNVIDELGELVQKPWLRIGSDNYDELGDPEGRKEIFVRNEASGIDYVISKEEGSSDDR